MSRRPQGSIPGASPELAGNVREAIEHLRGECLNASAIGAPTQAVSMVADALDLAAELNDPEGFAQLARAARLYLRQRGYLGQPERHELIRLLVNLATRVIADGETPEMATRILSHDALTFHGPRVFGQPAPLEAGYEKWSTAPQDVFRRVQPEVEKALMLGKDPEALVVAALVGYGIERKTAWKWVESAR